MTYDINNIKKKGKKIGLIFQHSRKEDTELIPYLEKKGIKLKTDFKK